MCGPDLENLYRTSITPKAGICLFVMRGSNHRIPQASPATKTCMFPNEYHAFVKFAGDAGVVLHNGAPLYIINMKVCSSSVTLFSIEARNVFQYPQYPQIIFFFFFFFVFYLLLPLFIPKSLRVLLRVFKFNARRYPLTPADSITLILRSKRSCKSSAWSACPLLPLAHSHAPSAHFLRWGVFWKVYLHYGMQNCSRDDIGQP
jgi:hypothetical protein